MPQKTVLITGATGKLGQVVALTLAERGYDIVINYRKDKEAAEKLAFLIKGKKMVKKGQTSQPTVKIIKADVTDPAQVNSMIKKVGSVDILINNVGNFIFKPLRQTSEQEFDDCLKSNLNSAWYCIKAALPSMRKNRFGKIINFGSAGCDQLTSRPHTTPYYIAKTGLLMLTRSLAREESKNGITINMISPGVLETSVVSPKGAPIIKLTEIAEAVWGLVGGQNKNRTGLNVAVSHGWRPE